MLGARRFRNYGEAAPVPVAEAETDYVALLESYAPTVQALTRTLMDPVRQAAVLEVELKQLIARDASPNRISETRAKLDAARRQAALQIESESSTREWRTLGKIGIVTGVGIGAAVILWILSKTLKK